MFLVRLQPAREVVTVRDRTPRLETRAIAWKPAIELENRERELILRVALPGCDRDDIEIRAARTAIAIAGERQATEQNLNRSEYR
ncbi:MAG: hypothetical protein SVX43_20980 [Cyanobacteriota bacterium]|nr:hypothetical protein [Cyanobacteriota bacterium]